MKDGRNEGDEYDFSRARGDAYFMGAIAVLTCPCHLPILILVLSGTAAGAFLRENFGLAVLLLLPVFLLSAIATWRLLDKKESHRP